MRLKINEFYNWKILSIIITIFLFCITHTNAQGKSQKEYLINGYVKGVSSGFIRMLSDNGDLVLDSAVIQNNKFIMRGEIGLPERRLFMFSSNTSPCKWSFKAFVEDTDIELTIDTTGAEHYGTIENGNCWSLIWEIKESGSELNDVYVAYRNETQEKYYLALLNSLGEKLKAGNNTDKAEIQNEIDSVSKTILAKQKKWIEGYINKNPSSVAGIYLFNELYQTTDISSLSYLQSILGKFTGPAKASIYYQQLSNAVDTFNLIQTGSTAPDFTLLKRDQSKFTLSSTRGNYTMIDFWASWCRPCRKAIPGWKTLYAKYNQKGFVIISVSTDSEYSDWLQALDKEKMPWVQVIDQRKNESTIVADLYSVHFIPFYVLLDKQGKVILASNDESQVTKKINEIFQ